MTATGSVSLLHKHVNLTTNINTHKVDCVLAVITEYYNIVLSN